MTLCGFCHPAGSANWRRHAAVLQPARTCGCCHQLCGHLLPCCMRERSGHCPVSLSCGVLHQGNQQLDVTWYHAWQQSAVLSSGSFAWSYIPQLMNHSTAQACIHFNAQVLVLLTPCLPLFHFDGPPILLDPWPPHHLPAGCGASVLLTAGP